MPMTAVSDDNLTAEQLVLLMKASREQYNTINVKMKATAYKYDTDNKTKLKIMKTQDIVSRWSTNKHFSRTIENSYPDVIPHKDYPTTMIRTYVITPKWSKRLIEVPDGRIPRGYIMPGRSLEEELTFYPIYDVMWSLYKWPWEEIDLEDSTVTFDEKQNHYIIKVTMISPKSPLLILYIDASKSFIPFKKEFIKNDGTLIKRDECDDFRQTESGLWIPYRYSWLDPGEHYGKDYEVEDVIVNKPIPDNQLNFDFPVGTIVYNEILNLRHRTEDVNQPQGFVVDPCTETLTDVLNTPVEEESLLAAASKAKELLEAQTSTEEKTSQIVVSPLTVLVTTEKYEYKLSVNRNNGTKPVLINYKFESTELVLSSLKNLIKTDDFLIVNINRLESHTGFASGALFLYFEAEDNPVKITFVSAPLSNLT
jgi:hypothetical protein